MFAYAEFISAREENDGEMRELILEVPIYKLSGDHQIVGLPSIAPGKV
jgi:hypothetical protein